jgi:hypothetical protein
MELDKTIEKIEFDGCYMNDNSAGAQQVLIQSSSVASCYFNNCRIRNINGTPSRFVAKHSTFKNLSVGTIAYGCTKTALLENCFVGSLTPVLNGSIGVLPSQIVNGVITLPKTPFVQGLYPGSIMFASANVSGGDMYPLTFAVLNVRTDGTNLIADTTLSSSFSAPQVVVGGVSMYRFVRHPCPNFTAKNCYGCDDIINVSRAPDEQPLFQYIRKLLVGYIGSTSLTTGPSMMIWGKIVKVRINVIRPYTGALSALTMRLGSVGASGIQTDGVTTFNWAAAVNLKLAGERVFLPTGNTGLQTGDVDPNSGAFWFRSKVTPYLSGDTTGDTLAQQAIVDLEIITDQGLPNIENLQFGRITFPGL